MKKEALLVILTTYASGWVENSMISKVGNMAFSVSGFLKVKELPFSAMRKIFSDYTVQESISLYAALGGCRDCGGCFIRRIRQKKI